MQLIDLPIGKCFFCMWHDVRAWGWEGLAAEPDPIYEEIETDLYIL